MRHWSADVGQCGGDVRARAAAWATASSSQVEAGEGQRQPPVRLVQRAARRSRAAGPSVSRLASTASSIAASKWSAATSHVGEVGHEQRGVGRRRALVERLAGGGDLGRGVLGVALEHRAAGGERVPPGAPVGVVGGGQDAPSASSSRSRNARVVLALAGGPAAARAQPEVAGAARAGGGSRVLRSRGRPAVPSGRWRGSFPRAGR